jgi:hypothetical protein
VGETKGTNLFIKNIEESVDDVCLWEVFSAYGNVTEAKVIRNGDDLLKGNDSGEEK